MSGQGWGQGWGQQARPPSKWDTRIIEDDERQSIVSAVATAAATYAAQTGKPMSADQLKLVVNSACFAASFADNGVTWRNEQAAAKKGFGSPVK